MKLFRYTWRSFSREFVFVVGAAAFCVPLYLLATISLKTTSDAYIKPLAFPQDPNWSSYKEAANTASGGSIGIIDAMVHSTIITVGSVAVLVILGSAAAYALARRESRMGMTLYLAFVLGAILPAQLGLVPLYVAMRNLQLTNTYYGMVLLYAGLLMPTTVFLYTGFIRALPRDYEEAAQVDGAGRLRTYVRVVLPLLLPITGTVAVLTSVIIWNDFFVQLIFLGGSDKATLVVAIYGLAGANVAEWNVIFAAVAISLAPIVAFFVFAQRSMMRGLSGGVKG